MKDECWSQFSDGDRPGWQVMMMLGVLEVAGVEYELLGVLEGMQGVLSGTFPVSDPG